MKRTALLTGFGILFILGLAACNGTPPTGPTEACTFAVPVDGAATILIPGGTFQMGSAQQDENAGADEFPLHEITLGCFSIYKLEVTNRMYADCVAAGGCTPLMVIPGTPSELSGDSGYANHPVVGADYSMATDYCKWAGGRLPTEAEWEYAASSSEEMLFPWGNEDADCDKANFLGCLDPADTLAGGMLPGGESPFQVQDMAGNAWEWVHDWYDSSYYQVSPSTSPLGPSTGVKKVARGGGYDSELAMLRIANRHAGDPTRAYSDVGFRCVMGAVLTLPANYDIPDDKVHRIPPDWPDPLDGDDPNNDPNNDSLSVTAHPPDCPDGGGIQHFVMTVTGNIPFTIIGFSVEGVPAACDPYDPITQTVECTLQNPPATANPWWSTGLQVDSLEWIGPNTYGLIFNKPVGCEDTSESVCKLLEVDCASETSISFLVEIQDAQTQQGLALVPGSVSALSGNLPYACDLVPNFEGRVYCAGAHPGVVTSGLTLNYSLVNGGARTCAWDLAAWQAAMPNCQAPPTPTCATHTDSSSCAAAGCKWVGSTAGLKQYCTEP